MIIYVQTIFYNCTFFHTIYKNYYDDCILLLLLFVEFEFLLASRFRNINIFSLIQSRGNGAYRLAAR